MALFSNMPRAIVLLLLLILSTPFIHKTKNLAVADFKLIQNLCHNSESPETCMRCVQSSKDAEKSNSVGIAIIIVGCINDKAKTLALNITQLASTISDPNMKFLCQRCVDAYGKFIAKKMLISAKQALQNHKYDNAESFVVKALKIDTTCHEYFKSYQNKVPSEIFYDMNMYEELSEAACRIIEKL
ncbi:uncharacterized protein LOC133302415 [Gastrolobium bilobum]|uniref:uncharacterized protein LOC133302415 n=1 Tax=Gastrolobium bilobum TaxID=150636 RepID=UPI002AB23C3F|nr:uncharacterized protein LOC133302415 [Gastrolobium bilobum]